MKRDDAIIIGTMTPGVRSFATEAEVIEAFVAAEVARAEGRRSRPLGFKPNHLCIRGECGERRAVGRLYCATHAEEADGESQ